MFSKKFMTTLPDPDSGIETLKTASLVKECFWPGDTSGMIDDGFILVGVCAMPKGSDRPFGYSLIWPHSPDEMPRMTRERWLNY